MNDPTLSKKMRESLALNQPAESDEDSSSSSEGDYDSDSSEDGGGSGRPAPKKARRHSLPPPPQSMTGTVQNKRDKWHLSKTTGSLGFNGSWFQLDKN